MSIIRMQITGVAQAKAALRAMSPRLQDRLDALVKAVALNVRTDIQRSIQSGPKSGRVYRRGNVFHRASAPGQAPASDTGGLSSSIYIDNDGPMTATIGSRLAYASYLEFGTRKIAPRPAWIPAALAAEPELQRRAEAMIAQEVRNAGR